MTEEEACDWLSTHYSAQLSKLEQFARLLKTEASRQSLIARSTVEELWTRHIVDSAQLVALAPSSGGWLDIGSGGGLPGLVVAILRDAPITLVEPRRKRGDFLTAVVSELGLSNSSVRVAKVQNIVERARIVSARAVAPIHDLLSWTRQCVSRETVYLLPRGKTWMSELEIARRAWHGVFHVEQSLTDPASGIVIATSVRSR